MTLTILVTGSRDWTNYEMVIDVLLRFDPSSTTIIHGGAEGLDTIADKVARQLGFNVKAYPADWDRLSAGIQRNSQMLNENPIDLVLGFRSKLNSKGTNDMLMKAGHADIPHEIYDDF